ncbi:MAG: energy-coupled thiamine transporter ThiT [Selenomonadaceae bacterium]|nr:energy-coupled thiamine transporter ThiT [Selenomonadaceae bacterium]
MTETLTENILTLIENPTAIIALVGVLILIVAVIYMRRIEITTRMLVTISLMLAMSLILHFLRLYHFPQGGSVTLGAMIPLLLISFRYGAGVGTLTGFVFGLLNMLQDPFILHPIQVLFDYPLPYMAMGLAGLFPQHLIFGTALAFVGRFVCHFISGVVFFASYAPEGMSPIIYSLITNAMLMIPEAIICCVILKLLPVKRLVDAMKI